MLHSLVQTLIFIRPLLRNLCFNLHRSIQKIFQVMHNWEEGSLRRWVFCIFITNKWNLQFSPMIFFQSRGILTIYRSADKKDKNKMLNSKLFVVFSFSRAFFPCPSTKCWKWDGTSGTCQFMWIIFRNFKFCRIVF